MLREFSLTQDKVFEKTKINDKIYANKAGGFFNFKIEFTTKDSLHGHTSFISHTKSHQFHSTSIITLLDITIPTKPSWW